jgi:hypothetical protein
VTSSGHGTLVRVDLPPTGTRAFRRLVAAAARHELLIVRPRDVGPDTWSALAALAADGVPTWVDVAPTVDAPLDDDLWRLLTEPPTHADPDLDRYTRSVRLARAAGGDPTRESVSVLLATRRPEMIEHAIDSIGSQRGVVVQLVIGLHGDGWPDTIERRIADRWTSELVTLRADRSTSLGALLAGLAARADGRLVTKWDDDDWYGPHHIADLVQAHSTSRAQLVGKAAEFVWVESIDETIRRPATSARTYSRTLAGGTLLMARSDLAAVGGFPDAERSVDRVLIDRVVARHGVVYRTHGLEFVLRRTSAGQHTWAVDATYFTADALARRQGLDLEFADIPNDAFRAPA